MNKAKFTQGEWEVHDAGCFGEWGDTGPTICAKTGEDTCQPLFEICGPADVGECKANAQLVASAPKMYWALKKLLPQAKKILRHGLYMDELEKYTKTIKEACDAIDEADSFE